MHVIIFFKNFLHWYVISLKSIFMHKLRIISCLMDDKSFAKSKLIEVNLFFELLLTLVYVLKDNFKMIKKNS